MFDLLFSLSLSQILPIAFVLLAGLYMAWNIGANDVANAIGTSVGSKALTLRQAVTMAAILEFAGASLLGSNVSETLQKGIVSPDTFLHDPSIFVLGMISALLATAIWLQIASAYGWPVSTTHAIVGAIIGFGLIVGGVHAIHWRVVVPIAMSWVISPLLSGIAAYLIFVLIQRKILFANDPVKMTKKLSPFFAFVMVMVFSFGVGYHTMTDAHPATRWLFLVTPLLGLAGGLITFILAKRVHAKHNPHIAQEEALSKQKFSLNKAIVHLSNARHSADSHIQTELSELMHQLEMISAKLQLLHKPSTPDLSSSYIQVEKIFGGLQILSAAFVAFGHGANDVANAIGPVAAAIDIILHPGNIAAQTQIPLWILIFGGFGIVLGVTTWGWKVIETIGLKITALSPTRGFAAELGTALVILLATKAGLPISTTHCIVGAVLGVGLARGVSALNLKTAGEIGISWLITIPSSMIASIIVFKLLSFAVSTF